MFSELLSRFDEALSEAKNCTSVTSKLLAESRSIEGDSRLLDPTHSYANAVSFPRQTRFHQQVKEKITFNDISQSQSSVNIRPGAFAHTFKKGERFSPLKQKYEETQLNPNYNAVKNNTAKGVPLMNPAKDLAKSNVTVSTQAGSEVGPGSYFIKEDGKRTQGVFLKSKRFAETKKDNADTPLFINDSQTKKRPPSCAIKKPGQKTRQLISRAQQQKLRQRLRLVYWKSVPLEIDRLMKNSSGGPVLRKQYFDIGNMKGRKQKCAMLLLLQRLEERRGGYEQDIVSKLQQPCTVAYRKSAPKPFKIGEIEPGPDYYYPQDDMLKVGSAAYTFAKADATKKRPQTDSRDYQINEALFARGGKIVINPEHRPHMLTPEEIRAINRGPGYYDCLFGQVQKRTDMGVLAMQPITADNARENNCLQLNPVTDATYFPNYTAIDPNVHGPIMRKDFDVHPPHLSDKQLFPEHWLFYDGDLNKVRAEIAKNVLLAKNMDFSQYRQYSKKFTEFKNYLARQREGPAIGHYNPKQPQLHVEGFDMSKQAEKTLIDPIVKPEGSADGDNLILHPQLFAEHIQIIDIGKCVGRNDNEADYSQIPKEGDRLLLNPDKAAKKLPDIKFELMLDRPGRQVDNQLGPQGDRLILHPQPVMKHIGEIDFCRQTDRPQIVKANQDQQENVINIVENWEAKGVSFARLSSVRLVPLLRGKEKHIGNQYQG